MVMSHPLSDYELKALTATAHEVYETFEAHGHLVSSALDLHDDFREVGTGRGGLIRGMLFGALRRGTAKESGLGFEQGIGGSREIHSSGNGVHKIFRVLKAELMKDGSIRILSNSDSLLVLDDGNQGSMLPEERWVFAVTTSGDQFGSILVAGVESVEAGNPGRLVLSRVTWIERSDVGPNPGAFIPDDGDALDGFDDEAADEPDADNA